jgi:predicted methyltransferase
MNHAAQRSRLHSVRLLSAALLIACLSVSAAATAQVASPPSTQPDQPTDVLVPPTSASDFTANELDSVLAGNWRSQSSRARDSYRHPKTTLQFFGVRPDQTVIEVTPGGGWYSEILAPLLRDNGHYIAAEQASKGEGEASRDSSTLQRKFAADPTHYDHAKVIKFNSAAPVLGAADSADAVLTFRNVHNWVMADTAPAMFKAFFAVLRPGGVLGVVDHRANESASLDSVKRSGYLPTSLVVKLATDAGFKLEQSSEINANAKDTKNYAQGVWTLPPTLTLDQQDRAKYLAIGESDRMTLRFIKPASHTAQPPAVK